MRMRTQSYFTLTPRQQREIARTADALIPSLRHSYLLRVGDALNLNCPIGDVSDGLVDRIVGKVLDRLGQRP